MIKTVFIAVFFVVFSSVLYAEEKQTKHTINVHLWGQVNNDTFAFKGDLIQDMRNGDVELTGVFSNIPKDGAQTLEDVFTAYHPLLGSWKSKVCENCVMFGAEVGEATSLDKITGGNFDADIVITILEGSKVLGEIREKGTLRRVSDKLSKAEALISGYYNGPTNVAKSPGYRMIMRQLGPGKIEATYSQKIIMEDGRVLTSSSRRLYTYFGDRALPVPEIVIFDIFSTKVKGVSLKQNGRITFMPADSIAAPKMDMAVDYKKR